MSLKHDNPTRKRLLTAGVTVFAKKGYRDATVREICKKAGAANINSINYYFGSKEMLTNFCTMLYKKDAFASDITKIFINEMTRPSSFIEDLVDQYNRPRIKRHLKIFRDLLGEGATEDMIRDCLVSVSGQLFYYSYAWPVFIIGLPRSGTTILQTLMALDPTSRYLRNFESTGPICPPAELIPESVDPRIQACHEGLEGFFAMAPVLQWKLANDRWILKAPIHLFGLEHLMETWLRDHPRSRFGSHACTSEEFGLAAEREKERFTFYHDQFDL